MLLVVVLLLKLWLLGCESSQDLGECVLHVASARIRTK